MLEKEHKTKLDLLEEKHNTQLSQKCTEIRHIAEKKIETANADSCKRINQICVENNKKLDMMAVSILLLIIL